MGALLVLIFVPVLSFVHITYGLQNLLQIVLARPFYLGDIIAVRDPGARPGGPPMCLTGFVENFTWSHIVIRDFECKQVWIHHRDFDKYVIHNLTRRKTKLV